MSEQIKLMQDQLVMIVEKSGKDKDLLSWEWGVVQEIYDNIFMIARKNGRILALHIPFNEKEVRPLFSNGQPVLAKKRFGKYRFPKVNV